VYNGGERGGRYTMKRKKTKSKKKNPRYWKGPYPPMNYKIIDPAARYIENQPRSNMTLEEALNSKSED